MAKLFPRWYWNALLALVVVSFSALAETTPAPPAAATQAQAPAATGAQTPAAPGQPSTAAGTQSAPQPPSPTAAPAQSPAAAQTPATGTPQPPSAAGTVPPATGQAHVRTLSVLPSTDTSGLNLAGPLQSALGRLFQQTGGANVQLSPYALSGFAAADIRRLHESLNSELLSFVYLEKERIAVFLFDVTHPNDFVVASQSLTDANGTPVLTSEWIEHQFRAAFVQLVTDFSQGKLQPLPGSRVDSERLAEEEGNEAKRRANESRRLFRELAQLEEKPYYLGASIGIARFSGQGAATSTVNFGAYVGYKLFEHTRAEAGVDLFNYAMFHLDGRYQLPLPERYLSASLSLGVAKVLGNFSTNALNETARLKVGQMLFGPGISIDIPLLGTNIRGDLRFYIGGGSILMGSYGLAYSL